MISYVAKMNSINGCLCTRRQGALIINVCRTLILVLPRKQNGRPIGCITLLTLYLGQNVDFRTYKAFLWSTTNGKYIHVQLNRGTRPNHTYPSALLFRLKTDRTSNFAHRELTELPSLVHSFVRQIHVLHKYGEAYIASNEKVFNKKRVITTSTKRRETSVT